MKLLNNNIEPVPIHQQPALPDSLLINTFNFLYVALMAQLLQECASKLWWVDCFRSGGWIRRGEIPELCTISVTVRVCRSTVRVLQHGSCTSLIVMRRRMPHKACA